VYLITNNYELISRSNVIQCFEDFFPELAEKGPLLSVKEYMIAKQEKKNQNLYLRKICMSLKQIHKETNEIGYIFIKEKQS